jgi:hypothetical protein
LQALDRHLERLVAAIGDLYGHRLPHDLENHASRDDGSLSW